MVIHSFWLSCFWKEKRKAKGFRAINPLSEKKKKTENSSSIALSNSFSKSSWQVAWHQTCDRHLTSGTQWPGKESGKKKAEARGQEICSFTTTNTWHAGMLNLPHPTNLQHSATRVAYIIAFTKTCISFSSCLIQLSLFARDLAEGKNFEQLSYLIPSESWMGSLRHGSPKNSFISRFTAVLSNSRSKEVSRSSLHQKDIQELSQGTLRVRPQ